MRVGQKSRLQRLPGDAHRRGITEPGREDCRQVILGDATGAAEGAALVAGPVEARRYLLEALQPLVLAGGVEQVEDVGKVHGAGDAIPLQQCPLGGLIGERTVLIGLGSRIAQRRDPAERGELAEAGAAGGITDRKPETGGVVAPGLGVEVTVSQREVITGGLRGRGRRDQERRKQ